MRIPLKIHLVSFLTVQKLLGALNSQKYRQNNADRYTGSESDKKDYNTYGSSFDLKFKYSLNSYHVCVIILKKLAIRQFDRKSQCRLDQLIVRQSISEVGLLTTS
jgi:hypothetical protein